MAQPALTEESGQYTGQFCWYIPPEIRDRIIDTVATDAMALRACSLACHAWLPRARHHLFRSISLDTKDRGLKFKALLETSPAIAHCVRHLELCGKYGINVWLGGVPNPAQVMPWPGLGGLVRPPRPQPESEAPNAALWLEQILPSSGPQLHRVNSLKLSSLIISNAMAKALAARFEDVRVLSLDGCKGIAFSDLIEFVQCFHHLETLQLVAAHWLPRRQKKLQIDTDTFPRLRALETSRNIDAAPLISWMLEASVYQELKSLSCVITGQKCAIALRELFHALGPSLEHLSISLQDTRDATDVLQGAKLDLTSCTGLRSLQVCCSDTTQAHCSSYHPSLSWVMMILSKVDGHQLEEITFSICSRDIHVLNYEGIDLLLSHSRFARMHSVMFDIEPHGGAYHQDAEMRVCNRMKALHAKGVLDFHYAQTKV